MNYLLLYVLELNLEEVIAQTCQSLEPLYATLSPLFPLEKRKLGPVEK